MNVKVLFAYIRKCKENCWEATWQGLNAFHMQVKAGIRNPINFDMY